MFKKLFKSFKRKDVKFCSHCHTEYLNNDILQERIRRYEERLREADKELKMFIENNNMLEVECDSLSIIYQDFADNMCEFMKDLESLRLRYKDSIELDMVMNMVKKHKLTKILSRNIQ